jgi:methylmalonyl-CoA mutase C-terminal domain/subunit
MAKSVHSKKARTKTKTIKSGKNTSNKNKILKPKVKPKSKKAMQTNEFDPTHIFRVLIAKPGLDGHDRGAKIVARGLRDAGFEVIYTGLHQTPEMVVNAAVQEDVDIIGLSILSGAHLPLVAEVDKLLKKQSVKKPIFVGGIIPDDDGKKLLSKGVSAVFGPGTQISEVVAQVKKLIEQSRR